MEKILGLLFAGLFCSHAVSAQHRAQFAVDNGRHYESIDLNIKSTTGKCEIIPSANYSPVYVISKSSAPSLNPTFISEVRNEVNFVSVSLDEAPIEGLGRSITRKLFGDDDEEDVLWKVYLSRHKPLNLNLQYVMGDAAIDLTDLPVRKISVNTGSADVRITYREGHDNQEKMDTFYAKVDMGSLRVDRFNLSQAREMVADVGFGKLMLDMGEQLDNECTVRASVGAGSMEVSLSGRQIPTIVYVNNSALCKVRMPKSFKKLKENVYVNESYTAEAENILKFDIDVSMGSVEFTEKNEL